MNLDNINKRNTREWSMANENSKAEAFRNAVVNKHGGIFSYLGRGEGWKWLKMPTPMSLDLTEVKEKPKSKWIFVHPDGKEEIVENLSKFCRKHSLNKAAMYEVYNGKRNHHKNFKLKKQGD